MFLTVSWTKGATCFGLWELFSQFSCILCHENQSKQVEPQLQVFKLMSGSNFLYNRWIVSVIFRAKCQRFFACSSFLTADLLLFFVLSDSKWRVFVFLTVGWTKGESWRRHFGFLAFYRRNSWLIIMKIVKINRTQSHWAHEENIWDSLISLVQLQNFTCIHAFLGEQADLQLRVFNWRVDRTVVIIN